MKKWLAVGVLLLLCAIAVLPQWGALSSQLKQATDTIDVFLPFVGSSSSGSTPPPTSTPPSPTPGPGPTQIPEGMIVVNHNSVDLFDQIPLQYVQAARDTNMVFSDRSVGFNISQALDCLAASSWASSPSYCRVDYYNNNWDWKTYSSSDLLAGNVPDLVYFDANNSLYNRNNWTFEYQGGEWSFLTDNFINDLAPRYLSSKHVLTYQFSYLNVTDNDNIANPQNGFFANVPNRYDVYDLEAFIAQHPDKVFIFWTTSLARSIGNDVATQFNDQMRTYAFSHDKILFDVADILSHRPDGSACYDNRDSIQYCKKLADGSTAECENFPDDGHNYPAICQEYTTETDGGHLGTVSGGMIRVAKGFWVLMAQINGWQP